MKNTIIENVRNSRILNEKELHFDEYVKELTELQNSLTTIALGKGESEFVRLDDAIVRLQNKAWKKGLNKTPEFCKGVKALREINKEIAICMAGMKGENTVAKSLEYVDRENIHTFKNVYLTDGEHSTEIDNVILTDNGLIVLEVKRTKQNVTITEEGRLFHGEDQCYERCPIGEKMENKRRLLKQEIEKQLREKGIDIELIIDSYIVFSAPKGMNILIDDFYKKEKYCRQGKLQYIIRDFESNKKYTDEEMNTLQSIMESIKTKQIGFEIKLNYKELFEDFLGMVNVLEEEKKAAVITVTDWKDKKTQEIEKRASFVERGAQFGGMVAAGLVTGYTAAKVVLGIANRVAAKKVC